MDNQGASVPDQALVPTASSQQAVSTEGFDPSRITDPVKRAEAWQLHFYRMLDTEREQKRALEDALDLLLPFGHKFAEAAKLYDRQVEPYPGSKWKYPPPHDSQPALATYIGIPGAPREPTLGDLRRFAAAYAIATEARRAGTVEQGPVHEGADLKGIAHE